jgi:hypothetical protein
VFSPHASYKKLNVSVAGFNCTRNFMFSMLNFYQALSWQIKKNHLKNITGHYVNIKEHAFAHEWEKVQQ